MLHAFYAESDVAVRGASYYITTGNYRVRCTRLSRHRDARDWPVAPPDMVCVGEVRSSTHEWDVDRVSPELSISDEFLGRMRDLYTKTYGRHDYVGFVPDSTSRRVLEYVGPDELEGVVVTLAGLRRLRGLAEFRVDHPDTRPGFVGWLHGKGVYCFDPAAGTVGGGSHGS